MGDSAALGIYLHVPFCRTKCRYCDFYRVGENRLKIDLFLAALHREIDGWTALHGRPVETIFLGGGTPSLLSAPEIAAILRHLERVFAVTAGVEVTAEANPSDLDPPTLAALFSIRLEDWNTDGFTETTRRRNAQAEAFVDLLLATDAAKSERKAVFEALRRGVPLDKLQVKELAALERKWIDHMRELGEFLRIG